MLDEFKQLFDYNRWASRRLLDAAGELPPEELTRDLHGSFASVLDTLVHLLGAEATWLSRWQGSSPSAFPDAAELTSLPAVRRRWEELWVEQRAFLDGLSSAELEQSSSYRLFSGAEDVQRLGDLMRHVINHATYHRGQVVAFLRQLGKVPPSTDYIRYLRESRG